MWPQVGVCRKIRKCQVEAVFIWNPGRVQFAYPCVEQIEFVIGLQHILCIGNVSPDVVAKPQQKSSRDFLFIQMIAPVMEPNGDTDGDNDDKYFEGKVLQFVPERGMSVFHESNELFDMFDYF